MTNPLAVSVAYNGAGQRHSPAALRQAPFTPRLVLPSANGSAIAASVDDVTVVAGSLRNANAVGRWLAARGYGIVDSPVGVIAAGERWPDGSLRPALEDMLGAGALISSLNGTTVGPCRAHRRPRRQQPRSQQRPMSKPL